MQPHERIIVALDYPTLAEAEHLAAQLAGRVGALKVGWELVAAAGPQAVRHLTTAGHRVFWDAKLHDIPNTVAAASVQIARSGAAMFTLHALGGRAMIAAAREAVASFSPRPLLLAVTVLTSHDEQTLADIGLAGPVAQRVQALALLAQQAGADGVVASAQEAAPIRACCGSDFLIVTPGVRPAGHAPGDQHRIATPAQALAAGANYLVIGRPITRAPDPVAALQAIVQELTPA